MTAVDLDALDAARAAATPGPWQYDPSEGDTVWDADERRPSIIALTRDPYGHCEADAALIVAAVNALPDLIAEARRYRALREAVEGLAAGSRAAAWPLNVEHRLRAALAAVDGAA